MKWRFLIIAAMLMLLGNVQNHKELTDLAIVSSIAVDKAEDDGYYDVSVQVVNSKKGSGSETGGSNDPEITIYNAKASTIQEALRLITKESPKKLHLANLEMLVICEDLARDGIDNILDFFLRNTDANNEFYIVISSGENKAKEVISILTPIEKNPTISLKNSLETYADRQGAAIKTTASYALDELMKKYKEMVLSSAEIVGDAKKGKERKINRKF
ncbi:MAG: hypothetical protein IJ809_03830 [Clostridia bacterium]|nr:hypothetical protein [Clostridia bacterium]